jgi:hypothetical protein
MRILIATFLVLIMLGLSACEEAQVEPLPPVALEERAAESQTLIPPPKTGETGTPALTPASAVKPVIKTSIGDLEIETVRSVDEVNGVKPGPNERLILITLGKPGQAKLDVSTFSLEAFDKALRDRSSGEVHLSGDDGSYSICSMAGWVGEKYDTFAMGFRVPATAKTYQLFWPGNDPLDLHLEN